MSRQLVVMGVDLTDRVISWGALDETKEVLLASPQILVASVEVTLENSDALISTGKDAPCLFQGKTALDRSFEFYFAGELLFAGIVRAATPDHGNRTLKLRAENDLAKAMEATFSLSAANVDPGTAMLAVLGAAGLSSVLDQASFIAAGTAARLTGAVISLAVTPDRQQSALSVLRDSEIEYMVIERGDKSVAKGLIIKQQPSPGTKVDANTVVTLFVSRGQ